MLKLNDQTTSTTDALTLPALNNFGLSRMLLVAALVIGTFLRLWNINAMGFNTDEAVYAGQAAAIAGVPGLKYIFPCISCPPTFYSIFALFILSDKFFRSCWTPARSNCRCRNDLPYLPDRKEYVRSGDWFHLPLSF